LAIAVACNPKPPDPVDYVAQETQRRTDKDVQLGDDAKIVPPSRRAELLPLAYFPIDPAYHVPAGLKPAEDGATLMMPTSTGQQRLMRRVGTLEFTLKGQPLTLGAFVEAASPDLNRLFVPFADKTTGTETYAAGRYLDIDRTASGVYEIDFNVAYFPYCAYNETYDCPFPPAENRLPVPIHAGERLKKSTGN
jgi:uncharacterized protein (DUF1684 family)